jgi:UDPglucose--hexose-1-phosphate uridylyltransferase
MPELRQNIITRDWVVIARERALRPDQFVITKQAEPKRNDYEKDCPFCPGNEAMAEEEIFRLEAENRWILRLVPNKYPAVVPSGNVERSMNGIYRSMDAFGFHDVLIEHRKHNYTLIDMSHAEMNSILDAYRRRYRMLKKDKRIESIIIFRNHGKTAGTSLVHPHSQIVGMPVVPHQLRTRTDIARSFFDDNGQCVFCKTLDEELSSGERVVVDTKHFTAFIPYAALSAFHLWIFPKRHMASFGEIDRDELGDLALNLQTVLKKLYKGLNNPDFNYTIRSIPVHE